MDFNKVYDILVQEAGAVEDEREDFLLHHPSKQSCSEWRFRGKLGFGGKFWHDKYDLDAPCRVSFYSEDSTPERILIRDKVNALLKQLV